MLFIWRKDNKMCAGTARIQKLHLTEVQLHNKVLTGSVFIGLILQFLELSLAFLHRFHPFG